MRVRDAVAVLGLSEVTIRRHVRDGVIASVRIGRARLIPATEIDRLALEAARSRK